MNNSGDKTTYLNLDVIHKSIPKLFLGFYTLYPQAFLMFF